MSVKVGIDIPSQPTPSGDQVLREASLSRAYANVHPMLGD